MIGSIALNAVGDSIIVFNGHGSTDDRGADQRMDAGLSDG